MESRHRDLRGTDSSFVELPLDFTKMVSQVFTNNFELGLKELGKLKAGPLFRASGAVYSNEIVLAITLAHEAQIAATTVYGSVNFDPKASAPTAEELLGACADAVGTVYETLLDHKNTKLIEQLASDTLSAFEEVPFDWAQLEVDRFKVWVKVDKANPLLDYAADEWLKKNDPEYQARKHAEEKQMEDLFVTPDKVKKGYQH